MVSFSVLAGLIASYVCGINDGNVPSVETTFLSIIKGENEKLVKKCVLNYASKLRSQLILPVEDLTEIDRVHEVTFQECKELFLNICFGDEGTKVAFIEILKVRSSLHSIWCIYYVCNGVPPNITHLSYKQVTFSWVLRSPDFMAKWINP